MRPLAIAVTGGIGAGKSEALQAFARRGIPTLSADEVVHRLIAEDPEVRTALEERFGTTDRARIGEIVFADHDELAWLEGLLHPRVRREEERWFEALMRRSPRRRSRSCTRAGEMRASTPSS
jgi:dephospho-CoA kinase